MLQIHKKIETERIKAGLTQDELAEKLGVKRSTYQYWEKATPKVEKVKAIAKALGKAEDYFFVTPDEKFITNTSAPARPEDIILPLGDIKRTLADYIKRMEFYNDTLSNAINAGLIEIKVSLKDVAEKMDEMDQSMRVNQNIMIGSLEEIAGKQPGTLLKEGDNVERALDTLKKGGGKKKGVRK